MIYNKECVDELFEKNKMNYNIKGIYEIDINNINIENEEIIEYDIKKGDKIFNKQEEKLTLQEFNGEELINIDVLKGSICSINNNEEVYILYENEDGKYWENICKYKPEETLELTNEKSIHTIGEININDKTIINDKGKIETKDIKTEKIETKEMKIEKININNTFELFSAEIKINYIIDNDEEIEQTLNEENETEISKTYIGTVLKYIRDNKEFVSLNIPQYFIDNNLSNKPYSLFIENIEINNSIYNTTEFNPLVNYYAIDANNEIQSRGTLLFELIKNNKNYYYYLNKVNSSGNSMFSNLYSYCINFNNIVFSKPIN